MFKEDNREFAGNKNPWLKRIGLLILLIGLFPSLATMYWEEVNSVMKWLIIFTAIAYVIYLIKTFIKDFFRI